MAVHKLIYKEIVVGLQDWQIVYINTYLVWPLLPVQDYYHFEDGDSINLHLQLLLGGGHTQYLYVYVYTNLNM